VESAAETPLPAERTKLLEQLRLFRDRLLNLDPRNRCLFVRRTHKKNNIDLAALGPECCEGVVWKAIVGEGEALLVREAGATEQEEAARVSLKALHREGVSIFEETGLHVLYVGFCWLEGHLDERTYVRGPLALVQAKLTRKTESRAGWYVTFDDAVPVVNRALLAALTKYRGVRTAPDLPDRVAALFEQVAEDKERSVAKAYTATTNLMTQAGVPAQMTPYSSSRTIQPLLRADLDRLGPQPLQFVSYHVLGLFPQSETALFADMEALIDRSQEGLPLQRLVGSLLDVPSDKGGEREPGKVDLDGVPASELSNVLPSDPSQDEILVKAKKAACVVVRGPPGTGKSQVIVNLIANCLAAKERVLLVCQKRAALDVVYDRLDQIGLSNIAFLVHDAEADRPALYKKLGQVLSGSQVGADEPRPEDVTLDQTIDQLIAQIRSIVEPLRTPIHGVEPYRLYARARHGFEPLLDLPQGLVRTATFQGLHRLIALIRRAQPGAIRYDAPSGLARLRGNWRAVGVLAKKKLADSLRLIVQLASDGQYTYLDGEAFREQMLAAIGAYQTFRDRWYRPFLPSWYGGKRALRILAHRFRDVPVEEWQPRIRRGAELSGAIQATAGFMHPEWLDTACTRIGDTPWLLAAAKELLRLVEEEFGEIQQHDQVKSDAQADELVLLQECACKLPAEADWGDHVTQEIYLRWIDEMEDNPIFGANSSPSWKPSQAPPSGVWLTRRCAMPRLPYSQTVNKRMGIGRRLRSGTNSRTR
jgi:hypothetical protein